MAEKKYTDNSIDLLALGSSPDEQYQIELQSLNSFFALAQGSFNTKSYRISIIYLKKILQIDNTYLPAYKMLAKIFQIRHQYKKAAEILRQAIDIQFRDAELHYQLGYIYHLQGNPSGFARECTKALVVNPNYSKAFYALALLHFENQRYEKARQELEKCLTLNPNDTEAQMLLARVFLKQKNYPQARNAIENILRYNPTDFKAKYYLGEIAFIQKDYTTALSQFLAGEKITPVIQQRIRAAFLSIKQEIDKKLSINPKDANALMELATLYYQINDLASARQTLEKLLEYYPDHSSAMVNYGLMLIYDNQFLAGIKYYLKVLESSPMNKEARFNLDKAYKISEDVLRAKFAEASAKDELLEIYMLRERFDKAILVLLASQSTKYAKEILQAVANKNLPLYKVYQGAALFLLGEVDQAEYLLRQIEAAHDKEKIAPLYYFLGLILKQKGDLVEAYRYIEKTRNLDANYWFIDQELNNIMHTELQKLEEALATHPNNLKMNLNYIDLLAIVGNYKKALQHIIKVNQSDLGVVDFSDKLGNIINLYEKELESKLEKEETDFTVYLDLGEIYLYKKRYSEAFFLLQNAMALYKNNSQLKEFYEKLIQKNIEIYEEIMKTKKSMLVYYNLAIFYALAGRDKESLNMLELAVSKDKKLAIQARYEEAFKKYKTLDRFRLITLIEGEDKNIYQMQD